MNMKPYFGFLLFNLLLLAQLSADYSADVELLEFSTIECGERINSDEVILIDLSASLDDKQKAIAKVNGRFPEHGIESPVPILIEKVHLKGNVRGGAPFRNAIRESAYRGCDLVIVLDHEVVYKTMVRPDLMELKLPVSKVLVLFGSQKRNSARNGSK